MLAIVEPQLTFLQVQIKGCATDAAELCQSGFSIRPETLDAIDVRVAAHKLRLTMTYPVVLLVSHMHDTVIGAKTIGMNGRRKLNSTAQDALNTSFCAVRDDLGIDASITFIDAEDNGFAARSTTPIAAPQSNFHRVQLRRQTATLVHSSGRLLVWSVSR